MTALTAGWKALNQLCNKAIGTLDELVVVFARHAAPPTAAEAESAAEALAPAVAGLVTAGRRGSRPASVSVSPLHCALCTVTCARCVTACSADGGTEAVVQAAATLGWRIPRGASGIVPELATRPDREILKCIASIYV